MLPRVTAHEVEAVAVDARRRHELAHGRRRLVRTTHHGEQEAGVPRVEDRPSIMENPRSCSPCRLMLISVVSSLDRAGSRWAGSWKVAV